MAGDVSVPTVPTTKGSAVSLNIYGPDSNTTPTVSGIHIVTALNYSTDHWNCVFDDGYGDSGTNTITISANGFDSTSATYIKGGNNSTINVTLQTSASPAVTFTNIGSRIYGWYNANPSGNLPNTVYTTSTTPVTGMTLYDSNGNDSGLTISVVNQDGSFDIQATLLNINFVKESSVSSYTIDGVVYTTSAVIPLSEGNHTLIIDGILTNFVRSSDGYSTSVGNGIDSGEQGTTTSTFYVSENMLMVNDYELGPSTVTITLWSSANDMGGSN